METIARVLWRKNNPERVKQHRRNTLRKRKRTCMEHYGVNGGCVCCGEKNLDFLSLDHIKDNGAKERAVDEANSRYIGSGFYWKLIKEGLPKGFQTLCHNCQWGKRLNKGFCPHHPRTDLRKP